MDTYTNIQVNHFVKHRFFDKNNLLNQSLKLYIGSSEISYAICHEMDGMVVYLKSYRLKDVQNEYAFKLLVKDFLEQEDILGNTFSKIDIAIAAPDYTLVPSRYLDDDSAEKFLKFNQHVASGAEMRSERIGGGVLHNIVYALDPYLTDAIKSRFGKFGIQHALTYFVNGWMQEHSHGNALFANLQRGGMDIAVFHGNQLQLCNSYNYNTPEDFLYYLLNAAEHTGLNVHKDSFTFSGDINKDSPEYQLAERYLANPSLAKRPAGGLFTPELDVLEQQYHRILFNI